MNFKKLILTLLMAACLLSLSLFAASCAKKNNNSSDDASASADVSTSDGGQSSSDETPEDVIRISGLTVNSDFALRDANKAEKGEADKKNEFIDRNAAFIVGDDNAFNVMPSVSFRIYRAGSSFPEPYNPESWNYVVNVYVLNGEQYVLLEGADAETYCDSINGLNATVDFSEEAIGNTFKIEVYPVGLTANQLNDADYRQTVEVTVVNGYNVYTPKQLSYINNEKSTYNLDTKLNAAWKAFKEENSLTAKVDGAVILQTNITLTAEDFPAFLFYSDEDTEVSSSDSDYDRVIGSLKDRIEIYNRVVAENEKFVVEGNYFTIDCSSLPMVVRPNGDIVATDKSYQSHTTLIHTNCPSESDNGTDVSIRNVNFVGNAPKIEDTSKCGGVILHKATDVNFTAYNNISNAFIIDYFPESSVLPYVVEKCKAYDAFDTIIYLWGSDIEIKDSELIGAGGPAMIVDHVGPEQENNYGRPSSVKVTNSNIHSYVTGQEAWFNMYNASAIVAGIVSMDKAFKPFGRSFVKTRQTGEGENDKLFFIDFVAFYKSGSAEGMSDTRITGYYGQDETAPLDFGTYTKPWDRFASLASPETMTPVAQFIEYMYQQPAVPPVFMTNAGGLSYLNPSVGLFDSTNTQIVDPANAMFKGDLLYLVYSRMGLVLNYHNVGETY